MAQQEQKKVSDMIKITLEQTNNFYIEIANHIDKLEKTIEDLQDKLSKYEDLTDDEIDDHK